MSEFVRQNLTDEESWKHLKDLHSKYQNSFVLRKAFAEDPQRFDKFRFSFNFSN
jgi:hypothetical protein